MSAPSSSSACNDQTAHSPLNHDGLDIERIIVNKNNMHVVGACFKERGSDAGEACKWAGQSKMDVSGDIEGCGVLKDARWQFYKVDPVTGKCGDARIDVNVMQNGARALRQSLMGTRVGTNLVQATAQTLYSECPNGIIKIKSTPQASVPQVTHQNPNFLMTPLASIPLAGW